jgi:hypothetical protein
MLLNQLQLKLLNSMISTIEDFRKERIQYSTLVCGLEGALDAGDFKNETFVRQWYDYWTPLEILNARKGDSTTIEDIGEYLLAMEIFLRSVLLNSDPIVD